MPEINPIDISHWLPHVSAAALLAAIATEFARNRAALRWGMRAVVTVLVAYMLIRPLLASRWSENTGWMVTIVAAATLVAYWSALEFVMAREHPRVGATMMLMIASAFSAAAGASGTIFMAQLGGSTTAGVGALWLITLKFPRARLVRAVVPMVAIGTWSLAALAYLYAAMRVSVLAELLLIPVAVAGVSLALGARAPKAWIARLAITVVVSGAALGTAVLQQNNPAAIDENPDYGYE